MTTVKPWTRAIDAIWRSASAIGSPRRQSSALVLAKRLAAEIENYANAIGGHAPANTKAGLIARHARDLVFASSTSWHTYSVADALAGCELRAS